MTDNINARHVDIDAIETKEWIDAIEGVIESDGTDRARYLLRKLTDAARESGAQLPYGLNTRYINSIPHDQQAPLEGEHVIEYRIRSINRWNAAIMVLRANKDDSGKGGHIASYASAAVLYEIGFNHFWKGDDNSNGDLIYYQGHSAPGMYARAFMEGRLSEEQLDNFRQEAGGNGLSSYPHPWLMPNFWQFPTVSMGLGPIMAIYQARFQKYLANRELLPENNRKVWAFLGDGEMDEPESRGALSLAGRESLDNLIFVINCNLQRLDGPVRGNGKIIQELESDFRGSGWNVIKVIWGSDWDPLLAKDISGELQQRMEDCVDGEYQSYKALGGAYTREHFWNSPELKKMVEHLSDDEIFRMERGGQDPQKIFAAYAAAMTHKGQPTVILAKTTKGHGMGDAGEGKNTSHQQKKMDYESLIGFRDRFRVPISDEGVKNLEYLKLPEDSEEVKYLHARRKNLYGYLPARRKKADEKLIIPALETFKKQIASSGDRKISTTMAFVQILMTLIRDKNIKDHIVPIVPDEARTFGMEGLFNSIGIYQPKGQQYSPEDSDTLLKYKESSKGQLLEEGINEAGAMSSWIAAATSYSSNNLTMIPFYIYYSMFGFQRIGDLAWAAGDMRARGFMLGGTAGRTTLNGEGLQHQDGHSLIQAGLIPNCVSYDPTFAYELAVIVQDGMERMYAKQENIFYYITVMNENYKHPEMPENSKEGILKGLYLFNRSKKDDGKTQTVQLMGSGTILNECIAAAGILENEYSVAANVWSATSMNELARDGESCTRWNMLHPTKKPRISYVEKCLQEHNGPVIAATDYIKNYGNQIRDFVPSRYIVLGTDGFGRSDTRESLRQHFEVDRNHIVVAALQGLAEDGSIDVQIVAKAIKQFNINVDDIDPVKK